MNDTAVAVQPGTMIVGTSPAGRPVEIILVDGEWCHAGTGDPAVDVQIAQGWRVVTGRVIQQ